MKIAFVGGYGHHHLKRVAQSGNATVVGVASDGFDDQAKIKFHDRAWSKGAPWFADYREMLDKTEPDVVSIGPVYGYTGEVIAESLGRGFKVVTDKPVGPDWEQFRAVETEVKHGGRVLLTELMERCVPAFRAAHLAVQQGLIGEPVLATAQKSYKFGTRPEFYKDRTLFTGSIMWIGTKAVDIAWYVSGVDFAAVGGHQGNLSRPDYATMADHVSATYALENGGTTVFHADYLRPEGAVTHGDDRVRVAGSKGLVEVIAGKCTLITQDEAPQDITEWGREANPTKDLLEALDGKTDHFSTEHSMYMARVMLISRDAVDQGKVLEIRSQR